LSALLAPYNVLVTLTPDRAMANLVVDTAQTTAAGGMAEGVLGCYTSTGEITLVRGWDWYTGVDASAVGAGQYDFETILTHELGHALGLGHNPGGGSVMHGTLTAGVARRELAVADLNLHDDGDGPDPLLAELPPRLAAALTVGIPLEVSSGYAVLLPWIDALPATVVLGVVSPAQPPWQEETIRTATGLEVALPSAGYGARRGAEDHAWAAWGQTVEAFEDALSKPLLPLRE
jgi:hypothetical protein